MVLRGLCEGLFDVSAGSAGVHRIFSGFVFSSSDPVLVTLEKYLKAVIMLEHTFCRQAFSGEQILIVVLKLLIN